MGLAAAGGVAVSAVLQWRSEDGRKLSLTPVVETVLADPGSPAVGATAPQVTVVVFTDYQCPVCRATDPALESLMAKDPTVRIIFKDWPIFGERSTAAARTALAGARQGKYLPLHRALMTDRRRLDDLEIEQACRSAGLDWARLVRDRTDNGAAIDAQLRRHGLQAWSLGLQGTPGYLVGPFLIAGGLDGPALERAVNRARKTGPPTTGV